MDTNSIVLFGRVCADAQITMFAEDKGFVNFTIAQNLKAKVNGEYVDKAMFFPVSSPQIQLGPYLTKGTAVMVTGRLEQDVFKDKKTGEERRAFKIYTRDIQLLPRYTASANEGEQQAVVQQSPYAISDPNEVPF